MTLREKLGQRLVTGFPGPSMSEEFIAAVKRHKIGNVILFRENIQSCGQLEKLCKEIQELVTNETGHPAFITIDQEGGVVTRLPEEAANVPSAMAIAASGDPENAYRAGLLTGRELRQLGVNFDLAPSVDINCNAGNPVIGVRSYSDNQETVSRYAIRMAQGLLDGGVLCSVKHFPGHGDTSLDSHISLPCVDKPLWELEKMELLPYREAIKAGLPAIMTTHILYPALDNSGVPATMSRKILTDILRGEMGFDGLIISDCMQMKAIDTRFTTKVGVLSALAAGVDLCFVSHNAALAGEIVDAAVQAAENGQLDLHEIEKSANRILKFKQEWALKEPEGFDMDEGRKQALALLAAGITKVNNAPFALGASPACLGCPPYRVSQDGNLIDNSAKTFPDILAKAIGATAINTSIDPDNEEIKAVLDIVKGHSSAIVGTYNAHLKKGQLELVKRVAATGIPTAVVAQRNPYDLSGLPENILQIESFEYSVNSTLLVAEVLTGKREATGVLPVKI